MEGRKHLGLNHIMRQPIAPAQYLEVKAQPYKWGSPITPELQAMDIKVQMARVIALNCLKC